MQHDEMKGHFYQVVHRFQYLVSQYKKDVIADECKPFTYKYENFRVKFLRAGNQQHDTHVDVTNADTAKRFLAFVCYLNDDLMEVKHFLYDYQSEVHWISSYFSCCMELST